MSKQILKYLSWLLMSLGLFACGFHMYTKDILPPQLHVIYVQSVDPYGSFTLTLKQSLQAAGIKIADNVKDSPVRLNIVSINLIHDNPNITSSSQATTYNFTYTVIFNLQDQTGKLLLNDQPVVTTRALMLNPNEVLEASSEVNIMKGEMERELVMQIFNRLSSDNVKNALNNENKSKPTTTTTKK